MIKFTESDLTNKISSLTEELKNKILFLAYDNDFINIINYRNVKSQDVINEISYVTRMTALGFASKQEMFNLIEDVIIDEDETRHVFEEIDRTLLVPNNLQGAPEEIEEEQNQQEDNIHENDYTNDTIETAEDILREIENPTPSPLILPIINPIPVITPKESVIQPNMEDVVQTTPTPPETTPTKETQLDSKLTEPVVQQAKSTYYKVDPYREQAE